MSQALAIICLISSGFSLGFICALWWFMHQDSKETKEPADWKITHQSNEPSLHWDAKPEASNFMDLWTKRTIYDGKGIVLGHTDENGFSHFDGKSYEESVKK